MADDKERKKPHEPKLDKLRIFDKPLKLQARQKINTALPKTDPLMKWLKKDVR